MNYGFQNEYDFVELFENIIDNDEPILSWKNKIVLKTDIFIKYKNYIKGISLKCSNNNLMHQEPIQEFKRYLEKLGISYKNIDKYVSYHYGYMKDKNGQTDFSNVLSTEEYKKTY